MDQEFEKDKLKRTSQKAKNALEKDGVAFKFIDHLDHYPPCIWHQEISRYFPFLSPKTILNRRAKGASVPRSFQCGRARLYSTRDFLTWLDQLFEITEKNSRRAKGSSPKKRKGRKTKQQEVKERRGIK
ncbi:hypothetical protein [Malonomonas rubra]|uniref:hypothetical protein n=1 Tax=Malonomonas rubra TaxID=57040 RepID=UPI000933540C|nr:hypothetical protein [Malonomonas rubra]